MYNTFVEGCIISAGRVEPFFFIIHLVVICALGDDLFEYGRGFDKLLFFIRVEALLNVFFYPFILLIICEVRKNIF